MSCVILRYSSGTSDDLTFGSELVVESMRHKLLEDVERTSHDERRKEGSM